MYHYYGVSGLHGSAFCVYNKRAEGGPKSRQDLKDS